jgi:hypothetical protein
LREKEQKERAEPESDRGEPSGCGNGNQVQVQDRDDIEENEIPETQGARKLGMRRLAAFVGGDHGGGFYTPPDPPAMSACNQPFANDA